MKNTFANQTVKELKEVLKDWSESTRSDLPKGSWKWTKPQLVEFLEDLHADVFEEEEELPEEETEDYVTPEEIKKVKKGKKLYRAISPTGEVAFETYKKSELVQFSLDNHLANKGWVNRSIADKQPVLMGITFDPETMNLDEVKPRNSKKYNGNFWTFTETEVA